MTISIAGFRILSAQTKATSKGMYQASNSGYLPASGSIEDHLEPYSAATQFSQRWTTQSQMIAGQMKHIADGIDAFILDVTAADAQAAAEFPK